MKAIIFIISVLSLFACGQAKQGDNKEQLYQDSILQEMETFDEETVIDEKTGQLFILSENYRTDYDIGINSTIEEFVAAYPDFHILYIREDNLFVIETFLVGVTFVLDENAFVGNALDSKKEITVLTSADFQPNTRITKIWVKHDEKESQHIMSLSNEVVLDKTTDMGFFVTETYRTDKGIGVNSTIEEFVDNYPDFRILYVQEKHLFIIETFQSSLKFVLSENDFTGKLNRSEAINVLNKSDFKKGTKITKIWIK
jgi:hypothetical protein